MRFRPSAFCVRATLPGRVPGGPASRRVTPPAPPAAPSVPGSPRSRTWPAILSFPARVAGSPGDPVGAADGFRGLAGRFIVRAAARRRPVGRSPQPSGSYRLRSRDAAVHRDHGTACPLLDPLGPLPLPPGLGAGWRMVPEAIRTGRCGRRQLPVLGRCGHGFTPGLVWLPGGRYLPPRPAGTGTAAALRGHRKPSPPEAGHPTGTASPVARK